MTVLPFAAPLEFTNALHPLGDREAQWLIFSGDQLLISADKTSLPDSHQLTVQRKLYMGTLGNKHVFAAEVDKQTQPPHGWLWSDLRFLYGVLSEEHYSVAGRALQLIEWDRTHTYCGRCGSPTSHREHERCRECRTCGHLAYPKLAPAIMALVKRGDRILLARGPHFPQQMYSVLAGYLDPGETLEQCVVREVYEEVGLTVHNVRYFGSQPWPFSRSLMIAFTCEWQAGEIHIDPAEIEAAAWFHRSNLPQIPTPLSIARMLIDS